MCWPQVVSHPHTDVLAGRVPPPHEEGWWRCVGVHGAADHANLLTSPERGSKDMFEKDSAASISTSRSSLLRRRLPASDLGLQRVVAVDSLLFCTFDNKAAVQSNKDDVFPFRNRLAALDPVTGREVDR